VKIDTCNNKNNKNKELQVPDLAATVAIPSPMVNALPKFRFNNMIGDDKRAPDVIRVLVSLLSNKYCA